MNQSGKILIQMQIVDTVAIKLAKYLEHISIKDVAEILCKKVYSASDSGRWSVEVTNVVVLLFRIV